MTFRALIFCLFTGISCHGQVIVNIEELRTEKKQPGLYGSVSANMTVVRNTRQLLNLDLSGHLNNVYKRNQLILKGQLGFAQSTLVDSVGAKGVDFSDRGFLHLRYTQALGDEGPVSWEYFTQLQYNKLTKVDNRWLLGTGPRFQLTDYNNAAFFWGLIFMYERERILIDNELNSDLRVSTYFSFNLKPQNTVSFASTTYVQPRIDKWSDDYRLLTENALKLNITDKLDLKISIVVNYDSRPPDKVPNLLYTLFNGLTYNFEPKKKKAVKPVNFIF